LPSLLNRFYQARYGSGCLDPRSAHIAWYRRKQPSLTYLTVALLCQCLTCPSDSSTARSSTSQNLPSASWLQPTSLAPAERSSPTSSRGPTITWIVKSGMKPSVSLITSWTTLTSVIIIRLAVIKFSLLVTTTFCKTSFDLRHSSSLYTNSRHIVGTLSKLLSSTKTSPRFALDTPTMAGSHQPQKNSRRSKIFSALLKNLSRKLRRTPKNSLPTTWSNIVSLGLDTTVSLLQKSWLLPATCDIIKIT
jgi:hypothetical protein